MSQWIVANMTAGSKNVIIPELTHKAVKNILKVKREGLGYDMVSALPALLVRDRRVAFISSIGGFSFSTAATAGEKIYVLYN